MRSKEDAQDYRYFPDPDLVPVHISDAWLEEIRSRQPEFKTEKWQDTKKNLESRTMISVFLQIPKACGFI